MFFVLLLDAGVQLISDIQLLLPVVTCMAGINDLILFTLTLEQRHTCSHHRRVNEFNNQRPLSAFCKYEKFQSDFHQNVHVTAGVICPPRRQHYQITCPP
eukprot:TRINITY_DN111837_c0_g1_i1.p1 TRINITY_DN111837_c0_g1~~TRINITY_DN111837_c0_g1_i1.p1  ORF type:complete len:100 (+),score=7.59 TRINITY_DN111837_c0_g1_i1:68-367(+)